MATEAYASGEEEDDGKVDEFDEDDVKMIGSASERRRLAYVDNTVDRHGLTSLPSKAREYLQEDEEECDDAVSDLPSESASNLFRPPVRSVDRNFLSPTEFSQLFSTASSISGASGHSPRSTSPTQDHSLQQLVNARLFGMGSAAPSCASSATGATSPGLRSDPKVRSRLLQPKPKSDGALGSEYTFKPHINERSAEMAENAIRKAEEASPVSAVPSGIPRCAALTRSDRTGAKKAKALEQAHRIEEEVDKECTFKPAISETSQRIVQEQQGKLKRWNTTPSVSPFNSVYTDGALANEMTGGDDSGSDDGSLIASSLQSTARSRVQTAPTSAAKAGGAKPGWNSTSQVRPQSQFSTGRARTATRDGLTPTRKDEIKPSSGDPIYDELHQMLKSLKI